MQFTHPFTYIVVGGTVQLYIWYWFTYIEHSLREKEREKPLLTMVQLLRGVNGVSACEASSFPGPLPDPPGPD